MTGGEGRVGGREAGADTESRLEPPEHEAQAAEAPEVKEAEEKKKEAPEVNAATEAVEEKAEVKEVLEPKLEPEVRAEAVEAGKPKTRREKAAAREHKKEVRERKKHAVFEAEVPGGVTASVDGMHVLVSGEKGEVARTFKGKHVRIMQEDSKVSVTTTTDRKADRAIAGATRAHINNMIKSVQSGVEYRLKVVFSHFPMNVKVEGSRLLIDNFLGEKHPRTAAILEGVDVAVKGQDITVTGLSKEAVSQTAANIELATKKKGLDPRVFQDGIYITVKDGKPVK